MTLCWIRCQEIMFRHSQAEQVPPDAPNKLQTTSPFEQTSPLIGPKSWSGMCYTTKSVSRKEISAECVNLHHKSLSQVCGSANSSDRGNTLPASHHPHLQSSVFKLDRQSKAVSIVSGLCNNVQRKLRLDLRTDLFATVKSARP